MVVGVAACCIVIDVATELGNVANFWGDGDLSRSVEGGFLSLFIVRPTTVVLTKS